TLTEPLWPSLASIRPCTGILRCTVRPLWYAARRISGNDEGTRSRKPDTNRRYPPRPQSHGLTTFSTPVQPMGSLSAGTGTPSRTQRARTTAQTLSGPAETPPAERGTSYFRFVQTRFPPSRTAIAQPAPTDSSIRCTRGCQRDWTPALTSRLHLGSTSQRFEWASLRITHSSASKSPPLEPVQTSAPPCNRRDVCVRRTLTGQSAGASLAPVARVRKTRPENCPLAAP